MNSFYPRVIHTLSQHTQCLICFSSLRGAPSHLCIYLIVQYIPQASVQFHLLFVYVLMLVCVVCWRAHAILLYFKCNDNKGNSIQW